MNNDIRDIFKKIKRLRSKIDVQSKLESLLVEELTKSIDKKIIEELLKSSV